MQKLNLESVPARAEIIPLKRGPFRPKNSPRMAVPVNPRHWRNARHRNPSAAGCLTTRSRPWTFLAIILTAFMAVITSGCKPAAGRHKYETATAARGDIVQHVTASGALSAVVSVDVGSQVSGKIIALYVDYNSPVKKGQLVAEIDPTIYEASLRQAEGQLASAQADVVLKQQNLQRKKTLVPLNAATQSDLDSATAELAQSQATVSIDQAMVESAQANVGYCKITAPVDGIVISRDVDLGQTVAAAMTTPILFTIAQDITKMNIKADVSEADIGEVKDTQSVDFTVDAFPDDVFHGVVTQVRKSPTTTQNVVTYQVIISVDNPDQKLFPGMTADVSVLVAEHKNVLRIPNTALRFTPPDTAIYEGSSPANLQRNERLIYATSADGMKLKPVIVKAGITDGVDTEILDGLGESTAVVTSVLAADTKSGGFGSPPPQAPQ